MTSGVIGARGNNATGGSGVNWSASIAGLRWDQNSCLCGYTSQTIEAIDYAVQAKRIWDNGDSAAGIAPHTQGANVRVLSNSYGCCYPVSTSTGKLPYDPALLDEVRKAGDADILFVASGETARTTSTPRTTRTGTTRAASTTRTRLARTTRRRARSRRTRTSSRWGRRRTSSASRPAITTTSARASRTGGCRSFSSRRRGPTSTPPTPAARTGSAAARRCRRRSSRASRR